MISQLKIFSLCFLCGAWAQLQWIAGTGTQGFSGDGAAAQGAKLSDPWALASGNNVLFIADKNNHRIRKLNLTTNIITTFAGGGNSLADFITATSAVLNSPQGIAVSVSRDVYIADTSFHKIRMVNIDNMISTVAGNGQVGSVDGISSQACLHSPSGLAFGPNGELFIADSGNHKIRKLVSGVISTVAGIGVNGFSGDFSSSLLAKLNSPFSVGIDPMLNIYFSDRENDVIRLITNTGIIKTIAGNGNLAVDGPANLIELDEPGGIFLANSQFMFFADTLSNRIRTLYRGNVTTIVGTGNPGNAFQSNPLATHLTTPYGLVYTGGKLYIADTGNHRILALPFFVPFQLEPSEEEPQAERCVRPVLY